MTFHIKKGSQIRFQINNLVWMIVAGIQFYCVQFYIKYYDLKLLHISYIHGEPFCIILQICWLSLFLNELYLSLCRNHG